MGRKGGRFRYATGGGQGKGTVDMFIGTCVEVEAAAMVECTGLAKAMSQMGRLRSTLASTTG